MIKGIFLPDLGEGIETGTIINIFVSPGETIKLHSPLLEIETDKATIEVPASKEGTIKEVLVELNTEVSIGQEIFKIIVEPNQPNKIVSSKPSDNDFIETEHDLPSNHSIPKQPASLAIPNFPMTEPTGVLPIQKERATPENNLIHASPLTRRFAREIGVDLTRIDSSSPKQKITLQNVKAFSRQKHLQMSSEVSTWHTPLPDFEKFGLVEFKPMSRMRATISRNMSHAWKSIPHVTIFNKADISELEALRKELKPSILKKGISLTITPILVKVLTMALKKFSEFNVSIDHEKETLIQKNYFNIGIATDSPVGLVVPVIRHADTKSVLELASEINNYALKAKERKISPADLQGGCITLSNLGKVMNTNFTPIINWPEVAILGISKSTTEPLYVNGSFVPKMILPLSLSFDHRVIDGVQGASFLQYIVELLETPLSLIL